MAKINHKIYPGGSFGFKIKPSAPGKVNKKRHNYNFLSFIIRHNKSISISVFVIISGFLFVYCSTAPSGIAVEQTVESETPEVLNTIVSKKPDPDLRKVISILNLDYSDQKLHGVFWREQDFASTVYLSFDDGPNMSPLNSETVSDTILDILMERNLKAVFFINGKNLEYSNPAEKNELRRIIFRMINEGHLIGNHSYSHHNLAKGLYSDGEHDQDDIASEFILTQESMNNLLDFVYPLILVRPPYAEPGRTEDLDNWLISEKQYLISLQFDSYDYAYKETGYWNKETLFERMETLFSEQENGGVLLLHELESTAFMLPDLLDNIILERGYAVEGMETLLEKKYGRKS
ncbi:MULTISPECIES: polysaccharide deacetylase family protein [unclassified Oceanispirochaeta]|uniref:polysaccharide deacetylase family protein n=1 Tax=unclassified Oceanispirochaeta TaxID=2635722 RepID=UPI0013144AC7|nr:MULTISPECIES: polysaccharide deacetylase family protein [unclassified Oceanispirochaeta]MBF9015677.1 polysaccharide deacetylase family protein [Oceanispirochaeta sp. M2]NPD73451.1 polysaccharide deacetylase family protein [Oceanispirochaeta sp. M1]